MMNEFIEDEFNELIKILNIACEALHVHGHQLLVSELATAMNNLKDKISEFNIDEMDLK